jgi:hypothetical protein
MRGEEKSASQKVRSGFLDKLRGEEKSASRKVPSGFGQDPR